MLSSISVGLTFFVMLSVSVGLTGGCLNPAIGISSTVFQNVLKNYFVVTKIDNIDYNDLSYDSMYLYVVGPLVGGLLSGLF